MKLKKITSKVLLALCIISIIALFVVIFTGCSDVSSVSKNISQYDLNIEYNDDEKTINASEKLMYKNNTDTVLNFLCLHLYSNAFREGATSPPVSLANQHKAYPNGKSYGNIEIESVSVLHNTTTCSNPLSKAQPTYSEITEYCRENKLEEDLYFIGGADENILYIIFKTPLYPDEKTDVEINFNVKLPNVNHRFGYGNNTINVANFYPIVCVFSEGDFDKSLYHYNGDPFFSDMSNYNVKLTAPENLTVANTGYVVSSSKENGKQILNLEAKTVRDFAIVLSKDFNVLSKKVGSTDVKYYYFSDQDPNASLETAVKSLKFFNETIGEYPYSTLSVVEANFVHGGMEFPNLVYISNDVTNSTSYQQVIIHEIAHQWWYNMVGSSAFSYGWLDEGLTEYSTALFFDAHPEYNVSKNLIIDNAYLSFSLFVEIYGRVYDEVDTTMNRPLNQYETEQEYTYIAYVKGMLLFDSLREILGEKTFNKCLQNYFEEYKFKNVTPDNLIASFEKTSRRNLKNYFNAWIEGKVILLK